MEQKCWFHGIATEIQIYEMMRLGNRANFNGINVYK